MAAVFLRRAVVGAARAPAACTFSLGPIKPSCSPVGIASGFRSGQIRLMSSNPIIDGMPRYANMTVPGVLRLMDWTGTGLFAFTGAITAASCGLSPLAHF